METPQSRNKKLLKWVLFILFNLVFSVIIGFIIVWFFSLSDQMSCVFEDETLMYVGCMSILFLVNTCWAKASQKSFLKITMILFSIMFFFITVWMFLTSRIAYPSCYMEPPTHTTPSSP